MRMIGRSIKISENTYQRLKKLGDLGDTFDQVIQTLLNDKAGTKGVKK